MRYQMRPPVAADNGVFDDSLDGKLALSSRRSSTGAFPRVSRVGVIGKLACSPVVVQFVDGCRICWPRGSNRKSNVVVASSAWRARRSARVASASANHRPVGSKLHRYSEMLSIPLRSASSTVAPLISDLQSLALSAISARRLAPPMEAKSQCSHFQRVLWDDAEPFASEK